MSGLVVEPTLYFCASPQVDYQNSAWPSSAFFITMGNSSDIFVGTYSVCGSAGAPRKPDPRRAYHVWRKDRSTSTISRAEVCQMKFVNALVKPFKLDDDGKIFICDLDKAIRIRTGKSGPNAL